MDETVTNSELLLLDPGPIYGAFIKLGWAKGGTRGITVRIICFIALTWGIGAVLAVCQNVFWGPTTKLPFVCDLTLMARLVLAGPLLIWAESFVQPWLVHVLEQFKKLCDSGELLKLNAAIATAMKRKQLVWVELLLVAFAFIRPHLGGPLGLDVGTRSWEIISTPHGTEFTWAYYWCMYVAKPLFFWLWLRWMWRYVIWTMLIWKISTLKLRLTPTHPDGAGGLAFVSVGQTKFSILSFVLAVQVAGVAATNMFFNGGNLMSYRYIILGLVILAIIFFLGPLLAFTPMLTDCKRRGIFAYGALAHSYAQAYHEKWISAKGDATDEDVTAMNNIVESLRNHDKSYFAVQSMRFTIIGKNALLAFALSVVAPFAPLLLKAYPADELLRHVFKSVL